MITKVIKTTKRTKTKKGHTLQDQPPYTTEQKAKPIAITSEENLPHSPNISVIVPVFNTAAYLETCLNSLLSQSHSSLEIICINDASTDNSLTILEEYAKKDTRIRIYSFEKNVRVATCRNFGLSKARGKYVGFLDSDDWISLDFYEELYAKAKANDCDLVKGRCYLAYADGTQRLTKHNSKIADSLEQKKFIGAAFQSEFWTALYLNDFLQRIHAEFPNLSNGEDNVFLLNVLLHKPNLALANNAFYYYRQVENSANNSYANSNIISMFDHFEALVNSINKARLSQSDYMEYYFHTIYIEMLSYYINIVFFELASLKCVPHVQRICNIIKKCKYPGGILKLCQYPTLKNLLDKEIITEADIALLQKEIFLQSKNLTFSYYKYVLFCKLFRGRKKLRYERKFLICKKIKCLLS